MSAETTTLPAPRPANELEEEFWTHCAQGNLCFQRCDECGAWRHPPRHMCPRCGAIKWKWTESAGRGRLFSWTVTHRAMYPAFAGRVPYASVIVELEEGVRLVSAVRGLPLDALRLDLPVQVAFEPRADGSTVPVFQPR